MKPSLDSNAELILGEYFRRQRKSDYAESARTTVRLLESLIRIAEAHARLMARDTVCSQDAIVAIMLVQSSLNADTLSGTAQLSALHHDFSPDPDKECLCITRPIAEKERKKKEKKKKTINVVTTQTGNEKQRYCGHWDCRIGCHRLTRRPHTCTTLRRNPARMWETMTMDKTTRRRRKRARSVQERT